MKRKLIAAAVFLSSLPMVFAPLGDETPEFTTVGAIIAIAVVGGAYYYLKKKKGKEQNP